jgi:hypothetical protein
MHRIAAMIPLKQTTNGDILACIILRMSLKEVMNNLSDRFVILEAIRLLVVGVVLLLF